MDISKKVISSIASAIGVDASLLSDDIGPGDLAQWDSLKHLAVLSQLEQDFSIAFAVDEVLDMETIEDIVQLITEKTAS